MYTLKLANGDLVQGEGGDLAILSGTAKIEHDLASWLLSEIGRDRFHPWIGASLDSFVGSTGDTLTLATIRHRVRELMELYYNNQTEDLRARVTVYNDPRMAIRDADPRTLIARFSEITVTAQADEVVIHVGFETRAGDYGASELSLVRGAGELARAELDVLEAYETHGAEVI